MILLFSRCMMLLEGDDMQFNEVEYREARKTPLYKVEEYLAVIEVRQTMSTQNYKLINKLKRSIKEEFNYRDLLIIQSSPIFWERLMQDPDFHFRRFICKKMNNLTEAHLMEALNYSSGAANQLFHKTGIPDLTRAYSLGVVFGHPWQIVNKKDPDEFSYTAFSEYFFDGVAKRIRIKEVGMERSKVTSISGYVITDPKELFPLEPAPVTGRWVTTYREMDYFEFHLLYEPLIDREARKRILNVFPEAHDIMTTHIPFRPGHRALWVMFQKDGKTNEYAAILKELTDYRKGSVHYYSK